MPKKLGTRSVVVVAYLRVFFPLGNPPLAEICKTSRCGVRKKTTQKACQRLAGILFSSCVMNGDVAYSQVVNVLGQLHSP